MAGVTSRDTRRDTHVTHGPAKAGSVTRWSSPPLGGAQCHAHAPTVTEDWDKVWADPDAYYAGPVDADLTGSDWAETLPGILRDAQAYFSGQADIEVMRDHYRRADKPHRVLVASIMGVGK